MEFSQKKNGSALNIAKADEGNGSSDMGLCIDMRRGIDRFWKKRGLSGDCEFSSYKRTENKEEVK